MCLNYQQDWDLGFAHLLTLPKSELWLHLLPVFSATELTGSHFLSAEDNPADYNFLDEQSRKKKRSGPWDLFKTWDTEDGPDSYKEKKQESRNIQIPNS